MNSYEFKPGEYKTREGKTAVVIGVREDALEENRPLVGYIIGLPHAYSWNTNGSYGYGNRHDLLPNTVKVWASLYKQTDPLQEEDVIGYFDDSLDDANRRQKEDGTRIACVEIEIPV